jgi:DNA modification methylase
MPTVKEKYGFLPTSVWNLVKSKKWKNMIQDTGDVKNTRRSANAKHLPNLKYSEFNPNVAERIVVYWSNEGDKIVDPFGGRATRAIVSTELGRDYVGYEIAPLTYQLTKNRIDFRNTHFTQDIFKQRGEAEIILGDGCKMNQTKNESVDLIMTCPPYHDLEKYENVEGQLSSIRDYDKFLEKIQECTDNIYRVLKQNKFCAWVCGDWKNQNRGGYFPFHIDSINCFSNSGLSLWDIIILHNNSPFAAKQAAKCEKQRYTSKVHEYLLIFKKEE